MERFLSSEAAFSGSDSEAAAIITEQLIRGGLAIVVDSHWFCNVLDGRHKLSSNDFLKIVDLHLRDSEAAATKTADRRRALMTRYRL